MGWYVDNEQGLIRDDFLNIPESDQYALASWYVNENNTLTTGLIPNIIIDNRYALGVWRIEEEDEGEEAGKYILKTGLLPPIPPLTWPPEYKQKVLYTGANPPETTKVCYNFYLKTENSLDKKHYIYKTLE